MALDGSCRQELEAPESLPPHLQCSPGPHYVPAPLCTKCLHTAPLVLSGLRRGLEKEDQHLPKPGKSTCLPVTTAAWVVELHFSSSIFWKSSHKHPDTDGLAELS